MKSIRRGRWCWGRAISPHQVDVLPVTIITGACDAPRSIVAVRKINPGVHRPFLAYDLKMQSSFTVRVLHVDVARDKRAKVFHLANVLLQNFVVTKKGASGLSGFAFRDGVKSEPDDAAHEQSHD